MLIIYHDGNKVISISKVNSTDVTFNNTLNISENLVVLAQEFPETILVWCHVQLKALLNVSNIEKLFHHRKFIFSYNPSGIPYLDSSIGYVDESLFIKINTEVTFPTWQMSGWVGGMHAEVLLAVKNKMPLDKDFNYFLISLAKLGMREGLLCYSEPCLLINKPNQLSSKTSLFILFRFVKQHYKTQWVFILLFNLLLFQRKFPIAALMSSLFNKSRGKLNLNLDIIAVQSTKKVVNTRTVDVIIPTIGRKEYLYNVLKDFAKQTLLPNKIIVVEQNSKEGSISELNYIQDKKWPFEIQHIFTHQVGACHARNLALNQTQSEWVFLADDDNRFEATLLSDIFNKIKQFGNPVITTAYPQKNEIKQYKKTIQWSTFGAGNSFVRRDLLNKVRFNRALEFGYGEDADFGMQLRNQGVDVLYLPEPEILHLKATIGGFRTRPVLQWQNDSVQPKPSPTIMVYCIMHQTKEQMVGYKTILFFKYYKHQNLKNPIRYYSHFQKQWKRSVFWANELKQQNEV